MKVHAYVTYVLVAGKVEESGEFFLFVSAYGANEEYSSIYFSDGPGKVFEAIKDCDFPDCKLFLFVQVSKHQ